MSVDNNNEKGDQVVLSESPITTWLMKHTLAYMQWL